MGSRNVDKLNYERVVDSFIPESVPEITRDLPLGTQPYKDRYELGKAYRRVYQGKRFNPDEE